MTIPEWTIERRHGQVCLCLYDAEAGRFLRIVATFGPEYNAVAWADAAIVIAKLREVPAHV